MITNEQKNDPRKYINLVSGDSQTLSDWYADYSHEDMGQTWDEWLNELICEDDT